MDKDIYSKELELFYKSYPSLLGLPIVFYYEYVPLNDKKVEEALYELAMIKLYYDNNLEYYKNYKAVTISRIYHKKYRTIIKKPDENWNIKIVPIEKYSK